MPDINKIRLNGTVYDIADEFSRDELASLKSAIERLLSALDSGNVPAARAILGAAILGLSKLG